MGSPQTIKEDNGAVRFFKAFGGFFKNFGVAIAKGDIFTKLSLIWVGAGYARRKQFVKCILVTLIEAFVIWFTFNFAMLYVPKFGTLGTVQQEMVFNIKTMKNEVNDYDHSFKILLYSLFSFVVWFAFLVFWMANVIASYNIEKKAKAGKHVNSFKDDVSELLDKKFHITLLTLPVTGIVVFTLIPILLLIFVAFTNYDKNHMPPTYLFTWVGFKNFITIFGGGGLTSTFSYAFVRVLGWTLVWAFFATITTYIGGIVLAMLINNKFTVWPKFWRTVFMVTIAVPQFVSLLLVRNFFADAGIVNTILKDIGFTQILKDLGILAKEYIPFLSSSGWAHVSIILINIWIGVPYMMLISTGILMNLPTEQLESARVDGAKPSQVFRKITMPYMLFITAPSLVTDFVKNINNFNVIYLLTENVYVTTDQAMANSQAKEVDLLVTWLFRLTQDYYNYKMASVIGIIVFIICCFFTLIAFNKLIKGDREEQFR